MILIAVIGDLDAAHQFHDEIDRKSTRLNSSHQIISYAVFCLKKKKKHRKRSPISFLHASSTLLMCAWNTSSKKMSLATITVASYHPTTTSYTAPSTIPTTTIS